jgi:hypothetical protein
MAELFRRAYKDPHYGILRDTDPTKFLFAAGPGTPTALSLPAAGYAPGCLFINTAGSIGTLVYANSGSATSATWTNIL